MEKLTILKKEYEIVSLLKESEFSSSYKCTFKDKTFFVKVFKDKPSFLAELNNHIQLKKYGIRVPKLIKKDKVNFILVYQFIDGETVLETIIKGDLKEQYYNELFELYRFARFSKMDLNYFPSNYKLFNGELYYLSKEFFASKEETKLENGGIFYWFYSDDLVKYLKEHDYPVNKKRLLSKGEVNKKIVLTSIMKW